MYIRKRKSPLSLIILAVVVIGLLSGTAIAKYIYSEELTSTVTFSASLAESLLLEEHEAIRNADGSYTLGTKTIPYTNTNGDEVEGNSYKLLPGVDVPKDPYVKVVNKTATAAYLFIEVQDTTSASITYMVDSVNWKHLGVTGPNSGAVYVYKNSANPDGLVLNNTNCPAEIIPILYAPEGEDEIKVSQYLADTETKILAFHAYLYEAHGNKTPEEIFSEHNS